MSPWPPSKRRALLNKRPPILDVAETSGVANSMVAVVVATEVRKREVMNFILFECVGSRLRRNKVLMRPCELDWEIVSWMDWERHTSLLDESWHQLVRKESVTFY